jgi:hypothetical protein
MRRRITRALVAAGAAGATITSLSFAAMGTAGAAQVSDVVNVSSSGWAAGNILAPGIMDTSSTWNFRYASGTTTVPDMTNPVLDFSPNFDQEVFSAQLSNTKVTFAAQLYWDSLTSTWNVQFAEYFRSGAAAIDDTVGTCTHTWLTGDQARLDVYYGQGSGTITYTAYDGPDAICTNTVSAWTAQSEGGGSFREAYTGGIFTPTTFIPSGPVASTRSSHAPSSDPPPPGGGDPYLNGLTTWVRPSGALFTDTRLFAVTGVRFTSYNGTMGTVAGPWMYRQLIFGTSASSLSNVLVSSPVLWNGGSSFGVWVRV